MDQFWSLWILFLEWDRKVLLVGIVLGYGLMKIMQVFGLMKVLGVLNFWLSEWNLFGVCRQNIIHHSLQSNWQGAKSLRTSRPHIFPFVITKLSPIFT